MITLNRKRINIEETGIVLIKGNQRVSVVSHAETAEIIFIFRGPQLYITFLTKDGKEIEIELAEYWFASLFDSKLSVIRNYRAFSSLIAGSSLENKINKESEYALIQEFGIN